MNSKTSFWLKYSTYIIGLVTVLTVFTVLLVGDVSSVGQAVNVSIVIGVTAFLIDYFVDKRFKNK